MKTFVIKRTVIETYIVEANSELQAIDSDFCNPISIEVIKETIKERNEA